jgi:hypothetical protein
MRQETVIKTYFNFSELDDKQKSKVLDNLRYVNVDYDSWYDSDKEDFTTILECLGYYDIKSYFTGFYSQGDGASFSAKFKVPKNKEFKERLKKLKDYAPTYFENTGLENDFLNLDFSYERENDITICEVYQRGHYYHENTVYSDNDSLQEFSRYMAARYYRDLENQYEYLTSDAAIIETIECNGYEFDADTLKIA